MVVRLAYLWLRRQAVKRFLAQARAARRIQHEVLFSKLRRNAASAFGREHGFSHIRSLEDFRRRIPVTTYDYYLPYVERVKRGEVEAMFGPGSRVIMFATTSGTTAAPKYIPVSEQFFREYRRSWNLWGVAAFADHRDLLRKQVVQLNTDWRQEFTRAGIPCGSISGLATESQPWIARRVFMLPAAVNQISHTASKQYAALRLAIVSRRVGMIVTANPLTLVGVARLVDQRRESLVRDVFDGTLSTEVELPPAVRARLRPYTRRHPGRARELEALIEHNGRLYPQDFWPRLSVLAVWTGGSMGTYLPKLEEYYGEKALRDHGLSASEGRMTTPFWDGTSAGVLDFTSHYFEFIPEEEHDGAHPTVLEAHELEEGKDYYLLLTTSGGLYRYDIHDVVRCVGFQGTAPLLDFLNKGAHYSSMTGEKLSEFQAVSAVKAGFAASGLPLEQFTLAPVSGDPPGYVLLIESELDERKQQTLAEKTNAELARVNCEYENRLETRRLKPLRVRRLPPGTFARLREERLAPGGALEQYKHPCLVGDPQWTEKWAGDGREGPAAPTQEAQARRPDRKRFPVEAAESSLPTPPAGRSYPR